jgi:carboxyl-terminal processing protease
MIFSLQQRCCLFATHKKSDAEAMNYALRLALAGNHSMNRKIVTGDPGHPGTYYPDQPVNLLERNDPKNKTESAVLSGNIGYILINNTLGNNELIAIFDSVLTGLNTTKAMILDLRNTPVEETPQWQDRS